MMIDDYTPYCSLSRGDLLEKIQANMSKKRFEHCLRVEQKILELAKRYSVDLVQASLAALVHDYAKECPEKQLQQLAEQKHFPPSLCQQTSEILHGPVGAVMIAEELGITHSDILSAVQEHTIGGVSMSQLSKCLFIADAIEDGRAYPGVDRARQLAQQSLDETVIFLVKQTLVYLIEKEVPIYIESLNIYNHLVTQKKEGLYE